MDLKEQAKIRLQELEAQKKVIDQEYKALKKFLTAVGEEVDKKRVRKKKA